MLDFSCQQEKSLQSFNYNFSINNAQALENYIIFNVFSKLLNFKYCLFLHLNVQLHTCNLHLVPGMGHIRETCDPEDAHCSAGAWLWWEKGVTSLGKPQEATLHLLTPGKKFPNKNKITLFL